MLRKCMLMAVLVTGILVSSVAASPSREFDSTSSMWQGVIMKCGLETIDQAPPGITPLVVESPAQLRELLARADSRHVVIDVKPSDLPELDAPAGDGSLRAFVLQLHEYDSSQWPIIFHLYAGLFLLQSGPFFSWQIVSCDDWATFTGSELYSETGGEWSDSHIHPSGLSAAIEGGGWIKHYIWTPIGKIHVMTYPFYMTINFSL